MKFVNFKSFRGYIESSQHIHTVHQHCQNSILFNKLLTRAKCSPAELGTNLKFVSNNVRYLSVGPPLCPIHTVWMGSPIILYWAIRMGPNVLLLILLNTHPQITEYSCAHPTECSSSYYWILLCSSYWMIILILLNTPVLILLNAHPHITEYSCAHPTEYSSSYYWILLLILLNTHPHITEYYCSSYWILIHILLNTPSHPTEYSSSYYWILLLILS
jgi:hypothetical protein